jgi:hypothetical protein
LAADFLTAVLMLTVLRVLYSIPLWFVRPAISRVATYVLFTLVFGTLFTLRTQQALGARIEQGGTRIYYPYPTASVFIPTGAVSQAQLRETSAVSIVEIPDTAIRFIPAFRFDSTGQARLRSLFHALMQQQPVPPDKEGVALTSSESGTGVGPTPRAVSIPSTEPFLTPVPNRTGFYTYPGEMNKSPDGDPIYADCRGFSPGAVVQSPYTRKHYRVPLNHVRSQP